MTFSSITHEIIQLRLIIVDPIGYFSNFKKTVSWYQGLLALSLTVFLFSINSVLAFLHQIPFIEPPLLTIDHYRLWLAGCSPLVYASGCLIGSFFYFLLFKVFNRHHSYLALTRLIGPALLMPLLVIGWPTDFALSMGWLKYDMNGFPGLWVRHISPLLTFLYMLFTLWLMTWRVFDLLIREAFSIAMLSLLPALFFWSLLLR